MKRSTLVTIGALVVFGAFLLYNTLTAQKYSCTVSVSYQGRSGTATPGRNRGPRRAVRRRHRTAAARIFPQGHGHGCRRRGARLPTLPMTRAVMTEILTAHFFVTHPHYLKTMLKLQEIQLLI